VPGAGDEDNGWFRHYGVSRRFAHLTEDQGEESTAAQERRNYLFVELNENTEKEREVLNTNDELSLN
jgi:hypothetical protein